MTKSFIQYTLSFIVLVIAQVLIFNHICIFNIAIPYIFIIFIILLPVTINLNWLIALSFLMGFSVDIFSDTLGMNALACTLLSVLRKPIFNTFIPRENDLDNPIPSIRNIGVPAFVKYSALITIVYCLLITVIQMFSFDKIGLLTARFIGSSILTFLIIWGIASLIDSGREKKL